VTSPIAIPYHDPLFTAEQVSKINNLNRNTLLGYVKRYNEGRHYGRLASVGIAPVAPGSTRLFSLAQVGILAVLRMAVSASAPDALLEAIDDIATHSEALYETLSASIRWESWGDSNVDRRPYLPRPETRNHLEARGFFAGRARFYITDRPYLDGGERLLDLAHFPLPVMLLPLDATLRNAWMRALWVAHGVEWED